MNLRRASSKLHWSFAPWTLPAVLLVLIHGASAEAAGGFLAGAARREITPPPGYPNWVTQRPYPGVLDPLFVRAVVVTDGQRRIAVLAWDLLDTREGIVSEVRRAVEEAAGLPGTNVLINASHSHSAPRAPTSDPVVKDAAPPVADSDWAAELVERCVEAVREAEAKRRPATMNLGRARVDEVLFNRRPRRPDGSVETIFEPTDPHSLPRGLLFGPVDPIVSVLAFRGTDGRPIATLFHLACHAVCLYPTDARVSADWPGMAVRLLEEELGGEALFLQGCAGDIVPARRGLAAANSMARLVASRVRAAWTNGVGMTPGRLAVVRAEVELPLTEAAMREWGTPARSAEVQVLWLGEVVLVALPGEPLIGLSTSIRGRSPFPHTLVLGYSNGSGVGYVGLPGEKRLGGYEMGPVGAGQDQCGALLIEQAVELLRTRRKQDVR